MARTYVKFQQLRLVFWNGYFPIRLLYNPSFNWLQLRVLDSSAKLLPQYTSQSYPKHRNKFSVHFLERHCLVGIYFQSICSIHLHLELSFSFPPLQSLHCDCCSQFYKFILKYLICKQSCLYISSRLHTCVCESYFNYFNNDLSVCIL